ncbi:hypothetical protein M9458_008549, partial [Cirrhinus mrigala]
SVLTAQNPMMSPWLSIATSTSDMKITRGIVFRKPSTAPRLRCTAPLRASIVTVPTT